jgi:AraC family transcriptional regulator of arabinose operon
MQYMLNYACRLLRETDAQIQDISKRVGYNNLLTFSKIFKNRLGISPKNYRELKRSRED